MNVFLHGGLWVCAYANAHAYMWMYAHVCTDKRMCSCPFASKLVHHFSGKINVIRFSYYIWMRIKFILPRKNIANFVPILLLLQLFIWVFYLHLINPVMICLVIIFFCSIVNSGHLWSLIDLAIHFYFLRRSTSGHKIITPITQHLTAI